LVEGIAQLVRTERLMEQGIPVAEAAELFAWGMRSTIELVKDRGIKDHVKASSYKYT